MGQEDTLRGCVCTGSWSHFMASVSIVLYSQLTTRGRKLLPKHSLYLAAFNEKMSLNAIASFQRLEEAASGKERHLAENRDYTLYRQIKARFEPINEPKLVVNTDEDLARCLDRCLSYVRNDMSWRNEI